ncbi:hypothetical protein Acr_07g0005290 [Actinidia rufa]|uniref:Uncharacterized protein n=1 Tax=Actinidia rufa TaxID=165716 RepID=A0A7J0EVC8_9ERIC|nr:hypothetical protein Acr_07g0005290 [Actinidia rufa]
MAISTINMSKSLFGKLLVMSMLLLMVVMTVASPEMALAGEGAGELDVLGSGSCRHWDVPMLDNARASTAWDSWASETWDSLLQVIEKVVYK